MGDEPNGTTKTRIERHREVKALEVGDHVRLAANLEVIDTEVDTVFHDKRNGACVLDLGNGAQIISHDNPDHVAVYDKNGHCLDRSHRNTVIVAVEK